MATFLISLLGVWSHSALAKNSGSDSVLPATDPLYARIQWKGAVQNPENPSNLSFTGDFPDKQWWAHFHDPALSGYIQEAVAANPLIAIAKARILESRGMVKAAIAQEFPSFSFSPGYTRERISANSFPTFSGGSSSGTSGFVFGKPYNLFALPLTVNYEADVFLKVRDQVHSAKKQAEAVAYDYQATMIALMTDVSAAYFNLIAQDELVALQKDYVHYAAADLESEKDKNTAGLVSNETVVIKESLLADAKAALQENYRLQALYSNQLAVLLGRPPEAGGRIPRSGFETFSIPEIVQAGIPSQLITRRPDILAAEKRMEASKIDVRIARKAFLPSFDITGQTGMLSTTIGKLLNWDSRNYAFGGAINQGLFTGGGRLANLEIFKQRYQEQLHQYRQNVLTAFQEVDNSLESLKSYQNACQDYMTGFNALDQRLKIQQNQFEEGSIAAADLYPTQRERIQSKEGLVNAKLLGLIAMLNLYKSLGGGF